MLLNFNHGCCHNSIIYLNMGMYYGNGYLHFYILKHFKADAFLCFTFAPTITTMKTKPPQLLKPLFPLELTFLLY